MASNSFEYDFLLRPQIKGRSRHANARGIAADLARISRSRSRYDVGETPAGSRRCLVKCHYVAMARDGRQKAARHLAYLERDGVERDGSPGRLYDAKGAVDRETLSEPLPGEKRQFRIIISPEDGAQVDLHQLTRQFVGQMERDLGRPLLWAAVNHHDTEHPHVHMVVRGVDARGKELRIPGKYIQEDMRARAQQLLTRELGLRTSKDITRQRQREIDQERFTSLDRTIDRLAGPERDLDGKALAGLKAEVRGAVLARLATLVRFGMVSRRPFGAWRLAPGWADDLMKLGTRDDIIKRLHRVAPGEVSRYRILEPSELTAPFEGVIRGKGLHDEQTGEVFAAVATTSGETHYVRLDDKAAEFFTPGDIVRISQAAEPWIKPTDKVLVLIAERNGGRYDPAAHLRELEAGDRKAVAPQDLVAGNVRRLDRLAKYGLVTRQKDGNWRVPPDLLQQLQAREASHPRHRLRVQYMGASLGVQSTYPGPTWLDHQRTAAPGRAPIGFAAELDSAVRARAAHLASIGLTPGVETDTKRLDAMERLLVGRRIARDLGVAFDDKATNARGVLVNCAPLPSGRAFARVVDERTKRLVLVPGGVETQRLEGREVEIAVDHNRQATVRQARRRERGDD